MSGFATRAEGGIQLGVNQSSRRLCIQQYRHHISIHLIKFTTEFHFKLHSFCFLKIRQQLFLEIHFAHFDPNFGFLHAEAVL